MENGSYVMNNDIKPLPGGDFEVVNQLSLAIAYHVKLLERLDKEIEFWILQREIAITPSYKERCDGRINMAEEIKRFVQTELQPSKVKPETSGWISVNE